MSFRKSYSIDTEAVTATVANNASVSAVLPLGGLEPFALILPTGNGSFTANSGRILFKVGSTSASLDYARDETGAALAVTISANNTNGRPSLPVQLLRSGWAYIQLVIVQAAAETAVTQSAERAITLMCQKAI